jgi:CBS domain-containing protein
MKVGDICSRELTTVAPTDSVEDAVRLMSEKAVRRLPVLEGSKPAGIVSLGDLAKSLDPRSVLGHISAAPPNR